MQVGNEICEVLYLFGDVLDPLFVVPPCSRNLVWKDSGATAIVMYSLSLAFQRNLNHQKRSPDEKVMAKTVMVLKLSVAALVDRDQTGSPTGWAGCNRVHNRIQTDITL